MNDGNYCSPDGGNFTAKDNVLYWEDGDISVLKPLDGVRCFESQHEDYYFRHEIERIKMNKDILQEQVDAGSMAEQFIKSEYWQYLLKKLAEIDTDYANNILKQDPYDTNSFIFSMGKRESLYDIVNKINGEMLMGQKAREILDGNPPKGIL